MPEHGVNDEALAIPEHFLRKGNCLQHDLQFIKVIPILSLAQVLAARKLLYALMSYKDDKVQTEALQRILRMPIHNIMIALYPRVYPLPGNTPEGVDLPRHCLALEEQVSRGPAPAYLITNGLGMWYHQSGDQPDLREAAGELAERIREVLQPVSDWIPLHDLPKLSVLKTEDSRRRSCRRPRPVAGLDTEVEHQARWSPNRLNISPGQRRCYCHPFLLKTRVSDPKFLGSHKNQTFRLAAS
ncbi:unnamed protein product [Cladocopium goreaui]|uniref:GATA-type domain-containing protein n=1 Tax=Cladocopium goreaui TaxID=2562237 RepID=A0A9P1G866_9DINO|nr:unnamed protein product [Cladocopium goreaui]